MNGVEVILQRYIFLDSVVNVFRCLINHDLEILTLRWMVFSLIVYKDLLQQPSYENDWKVNSHFCRIIRGSVYTPLDFGLKFSILEASRRLNSFQVDPGISHVNPYPVASASLLFHVLIFLITSCCSGVFGFGMLLLALCLGLISPFVNVALQEQNIALWMLACK